MEIHKPIFIVGAGRSGSTIFHKIMSEHPQVAWLSGISNRYPHKPHWNNFLMRMLDYPLLGEFIKTKINPSEAYNFWDMYCNGFSRPFRDLSEKDVTIKNIKNVKDILSKQLTKNRTQMLVKITGWSRMGFLHQIFNDAKFIHIVRDGRAVANSVMNVDWWQGWLGPHKWRWGMLDSRYQKVWEKHNKSFVALAGIQWNLMIDAIENSKLEIPESQFTEIRYEDLCSNKEEILRMILDFCELPWAAKFEKSIVKYKLKDENMKWQKNLTISQQNILQDVISEHLIRYNYLL